MPGARAIAIVVGVLLTAAACAGSPTASPTIRVGSKSFTESYILAEMVAEAAELLSSGLGQRVRVSR